MTTMTNACPPATDTLFSPFSVGTLTVPNRIVMAPMTRQHSPGGVPGPDVATYYARRALHGVGLIITEGTVVDHPASANRADVPRIFGADAQAGWTDVVRQVHAADGRIMVQLWHVGGDRKPDDQPNPGVPPAMPSGVLPSGTPIAAPMSDEAIAAVIDAFARGAADAKRLGFDGVELHGAHGYLIDEFFWSATNRRIDRYGGSIRARSRFAAEIVRACRQAVGPDFPIFLRISQWKIADFGAKLVSDPGELEEFLEPLVAAGVDVFHCSTRRFWLPEFPGSNLTMAGWTKKLSGKPTIAVGSVGFDNSEFQSALLEGRGADIAPLDRLIDMVERGEFDLVAAGRALLADATWAAKIRDGRIDDLQPFRPDALATLL